MATSSVIAGGFGVFVHHPEDEPGVAAEIESLGYSTIWVPDIAEERLADIEGVLAATQAIRVGSGIVNIWTTPVAAAANFYHRAQERYPDRFVLGIGLGHRERDGGVYEKPYDATVSYLDGLVAAGVPQERIVLAALRKRILGLARDRTAGAYPVNMPLAHTRFARQTLGFGSLLAVGHNVVLDEDAEAARRTVRESANYYANLVNYVNAWHEFGFPDVQVGDQVSDELVDAISSHGSPTTVAQGITAHLDAGADQVVIRVLPDDGGRKSLPALAALAEQLGLPLTDHQ